MSNVVSKIGNIIGKSINTYHNNILKPRLDDLKFKEEYQGRIIDCMLGEVDDNYITTPETDAPIVKLEHSKEGVIKIPSIKGKTILVDADGNETDTPAEGCRLVSVGEQEDNKLIILSKNKNLFNGEVGKNFINPSTGENVTWVEYWRSKDYIECVPNEKYYVSFKYNGIVKDGAMFFYDKNKNFIKMTYNSPYTTPSNCKFIRIGGKGVSEYAQPIDMTKLTDIMLYSGVSAYDYIEPKHHKTEILLNEPLRSLPNGVCDEIVGNKIIRRTTKVVLDGVENKFRDNYSASASVEGFYSYRYDNENMPLKSWGSMDCVVCNKYPSVNYGAWNSPTENCVSVHSSIKAIYVSLQNDMLDITSSDNVTIRSKKANEWLKENPIEIVYELAEPIIEELPNGITLQGYDDTTMHIENSITPTVTYGYNALIPYKEELLNQQEEVEINTLDIENNIIPYLMDMEFNLMTMEDNE